MHLKSIDSTRINELIESFLKDSSDSVEDVLDEYEGFPFDEDHEAALLVTKPYQGWISLIGNIEFEFELLAEHITRQLNDTALVVSLIDSDYWGYVLYERGRALDEYQSYFLFGNDEYRPVSFQTVDPTMSSSDAADYDCSQHFDKLSPLFDGVTKELLTQTMVTKSTFAEEPLISFLKCSKSLNSMQTCCIRNSKV
ncbi:hypothetical protein [Polystyrenella longa]|nr:hypothetical protein [Polystyrenella longa]